MKTRRLTLVGLLAVVSLEAHAQTVTLSDSTFNVYNWSSTAATVGGANPIQFTLDQVASGGDPGSYLSLVVSQTSPATAPIFNGEYPAIGGITSSALSYNPSVQGAITSISISVNLDSQNGYGIFVDPFFVQGGNLFVSNNPLVFLAGSNGWSSYTATINLQQVNEFTPAGQNLSSYGPNTTLSGGLITFGLGTQEQTAGPLSGTIGIDNLTYTLNTQAIPEPSTWTMLAMGGAGLVIIARRRVKA